MPCNYGCKSHTDSDDMIICSGGIYNFPTGIVGEGFIGLCSDKLTQLDLSDNNITHLPYGVFDLLPNLNSLFLYENNITHLPYGLFDKLR